ncbi:MAG: carbohydrate-binding protein, partial [Prosthecobacter sp.]|nr:carbohydrate-binding protein [Prosthecobacter sp.]
QNNGAGPLTGLNGSYITGVNAASFHISTVPAASVIGGATTSLVVTFAPRTSGPQTAVLHLISMDADENPFDTTLNGYGGEPVTTWKQRHFGETTNVGVHADTADPDSDGVTNLEEYALGLDPTVKGKADLTFSFDNGGFAPPSNEGESSSPPPGEFLFFTYNRNKLALADVIFQVEWSNTLAANDWHTTEVSEVVMSEVGNLQQVQATVPKGAAGRRFVRLKMTRP